MKVELSARSVEEDRDRWSHSALISYEVSSNGLEATAPSILKYVCVENAP